MSEEVKRALIGRVELGKTKGGKPVANLFSADTRLEYPVMSLFDLSMLELVGIDPNTLDSEPVYRRFWAHYVESEKTTSKGNPYLDCQYLEPIEAAGTGSNGDDSALVETMIAMTTELRATRAILEILASRLGATLQVDLGAAGEDAETNADWIADAETRAEEQAIHDELQAMHQVAQNGKTETGVPMDAGELVAWINRRGKGPECMGAGHLAYACKKIHGPDWGWPTATDQEGWNQAAAAWYEYWKVLV